MTASQGSDPLASLSRRELEEKLWAAQYRCDSKRVTELEELLERKKQEEIQAAGR